MQHQEACGLAEAACKAKAGKTISVQHPENQESGVLTSVMVVSRRLAFGDEQQAERKEALQP